MSKKSSKNAKQAKRRVKKKKMSKRRTPKEGPVLRGLALQKKILRQAIPPEEYSSAPRRLKKDERFFDLVKRLSMGQVPYSTVKRLANDSSTLIGTATEIFNSPSGIPVLVKVAECSADMSHFSETEFLVIHRRKNRRISFYHRQNGVIGLSDKGKIYLIPKKIERLPADIRKWEGWAASYYLKQHFSDIRNRSRVTNKTASISYRASNLVQLRRINRNPSKKQLRKERGSSPEEDVDSIDLSFSQE